MTTLISSEPKYHGFTNGQSYEADVHKKLRKKLSKRIRGKQWIYRKLQTYTYISHPIVDAY